MVLDSLHDCLTRRSRTGRPSPAPGSRNSLTTRTRTVCRPPPEFLQVQSVKPPPKDGGRLLVNKDVTPYHLDVKGAKVRMHDRVVMDDADGTKYMMKSDAVSRTIREWGTVHPSDRSRQSRFGKHSVWLS